VYPFALVSQYSSDSQTEKKVKISLSPDGLSRLYSVQSFRNRRKGVLQVFKNGMWGSVCIKNGFSRDAANVACLHLGFTGATNFSINEVNQNEADFSNWLNQIEM